MKHALFTFTLALPAALLLTLLLGGCQLLGVAAAKAPPPTVPAAYDDLGGHSAAVWVWVDQRIDLDYPSLWLEVATRIQNRLETARDTGTARQRRELRELDFKIKPASFGRYKDDPAIQMTPVRTLASRLGVERVIFVEIVDFATEGGLTAGMWRGEAKVNIQVYAVDPDSREAERVYDEPNRRVVFPPGGVAQGSTQLGAERTYAGLVLQIVDEVSKRFLSHSSEN